MAWEEEEEEEEEELSERALPVAADADAPDCDAGPPEDGMAYLRSVRWEAASIPGVSRAALDPLQFESRRTAYTPRTASFQPPPPGAEVKQEWRQEFVSHFSALRNGLQTAALALCERAGSCDSAHQPLGASDDSGYAGTAAAAAWPGHEPILRELQRMDEVSTLRRLHACIDSLDGASRLSREQALWLFALLVRVDLPIDADTGAHVRHACRRLCTMRAEAAAHGPEHLAWLNILIAASELVGRFHSDAES